MSDVDDRLGKIEDECVDLANDRRTASRLVDLVRELAGVVRDATVPIEEQRTHLSAHREIESRLVALEGGAERFVEDLVVGQEYELTLRVRATVVERHDSNGLCLKLLLDQRDYVAPRIVDVDADEIESAQPL